MAVTRQQLLDRAPVTWHAGNRGREVGQWASTTRAFVPIRTTSTATEAMDVLLTEQMFLKEV